MAIKGQFSTLQRLRYCDIHWSRSPTVELGKLLCKPYYGSGAIGVKCPPPPQQGFFSFLGFVDFLAINMHGPPNIGIMVTFIASCGLYYTPCLVILIIIEVDDLKHFCRNIWQHFCSLHHWLSCKTLNSGTWGLCWEAWMAAVNLLISHCTLNPTFVGFSRSFID